jgi:enoyl-CoA hydratase/carnithine racemase
MASTTDEVLVQDSHGIRRVTLNRPETKNALTIETNAKVIAAFTDAAQNPDIRVIILTGAGGAFCSGLDLKVAATLGLDPESYAKALRTHFHGMILSITSCLKPVIALVDGPAAGYGCDLALACDLRIASDRARFAELFIKRGLMPDGGGTFTLPRLVGLGRALELMYTGDTIDAAEAHRIGMVNRVHPQAEVEAATQKLAATFAAQPPLAYREIKQAVYRALSSSFDQALEGEVAGQTRLLGSEDFAEGAAAFMEKRAPSFKGR